MIFEEVDEIDFAEFIHSLNTNIELIKIDIEGMEMDALLGAKLSIEKLKPVLMIEKIKSNNKLTIKKSKFV